MKISENFKLVWWSILVITMGLFLYGRYDDLLIGKQSYFDAVVFLVWIGICLAPIFNEMNIFGVKLKRDIDELKRDIDHQLSILKTEIKSSIEVSSANSNQIYVSTSPEPPKDSEIPSIEAQLKEALNKTGISVDKETIVSEYLADPVQVEMFKIRLSFEKLLRKYATVFGRDAHRYTFGRLLHNFKSMEILPNELIVGAKEVISICNYAIHDEKLTDAQISFVRDSAPSLLRALEKELRNAL